MEVLVLVQHWFQCDILYFTSSFNFIAYLTKFRRVNWAKALRARKTCYIADFLLVEKSERQLNTKIDQGQQKNIWINFFPFFSDNSQVFVLSNWFVKNQDWFNKNISAEHTSLCFLLVWKNANLPSHDFCSTWLTYLPIFVWAF